MNNNDNTKNNNHNFSNLPIKFKLIAIGILTFGALVFIGLIIFAISVWDEGKFGSILIIASVISFLYAFIIPSLKFRTGSANAKKEINKEDTRIKNDNQYVYLRELPNNFGIGVTTLLMDSTIENSKDIVAVILDLCAKKYLYLSKHNDKYIIKVLKPIDNGLLSNESYILSLIIANNLKSINYEEWFGYCLGDGKMLGLYDARNVEKNGTFTGISKDKIKKRRKTITIISIVIACLIFLGNLDSIIMGIMMSFLIFFICWGILGIIVYIINIVEFSRSFSKFEKKIGYDEEMRNNLVRTQKGILEYQKLLAFKAFMNDFGHFVDKHVEEVKLWDRYLSYAQVFGLTRNIMNSGYKELVVNSSFSIDDIDNINFDNIEIE